MGFLESISNIYSSQTQKNQKKDSKSKTSSGWPETETEGFTPTAIGTKISSDYMRML